MIPTDRVIDIGAKTDRPQLVALLFCDWVNTTIENKYNLIGIFDRMIIDRSLKRTSNFGVFIKLAQTLINPIRLTVFQPDGTVGIEALLETQDVVQIAGEPASIFFVSRLEFAVPEPGIYWFEIAYRDHSLGGAALVVEFQPGQGI